MRSTLSELKNRGYLSDSDYVELIRNMEKNTCEYLLNTDPVIRSASIRKMKLNKEYEHIKILCDMLKTESKLYTKLELCDCLASFKSKSIPYLLPLLGAIGKNQHRDVGNYDLNKKSYPLPRDIVARIIIRIGPEVLDSIHNLRDYENNVNQLSELIDVIGHITFTSKDYRLETELISLYKRNEKEIIKWKLIRAFQSFQSNDIIKLLEEVINSDDDNKVMIKEAERSLLRIKERRNA